MTFGQQIRKLREDKGLGQRQLARMAALSLSHLQDIEHDRKRPKDATLAKLAPRLGVTTKSLVRTRDEYLADTNLTLLLKETDDLTPEQRQRLLDIALDLLQAEGTNVRGG